MTPINIAGICRILANDPILLRSMTELGHHLGLSDAAIIPSRNRYVMGAMSPYALVYGVLNQWVSINGEAEATITRLIEILEEKLQETVEYDRTEQDVTAGRELKPQREPQVGKVFNVTPAVATFVGREEELVQFRKLWEYNATLSVLLTGFAGVGKTQLAKKFMEEIGKRDIPPAVTWFSGHNYSGLRSSIEECALQYDIMAGYKHKAMPSSVVEILRKLHSILLCDGEKHRWVVVIDGVDNEFTELAPVMRELRRLKVFTIITTRLTNMTTGFDNIAIPVLALDLRSNHSKRDVDDTQLPNYEPVCFLGIGGFGVVFLLKAGESDANVALKVLCPDAEDLRNVIKRECETMEDPLNHHENVMKVLDHYIVRGVAVHDLIQTWATRNNQLIPALALQLQIRFDGLLVQLKREGREALCIEMEPCGPTLRKWFETHMDAVKGEVGKEGLADDCHQIAGGLISGLRFLHSRGIVHRDLTPLNIFFTFGNEKDEYKLPVKIGDFGQSKWVSGTESLPCSHSNPFSVPYRAKEATFSEHEDGMLRYGMNADWYSLGLILYEVFYIAPTAQLALAFDKLVVDEKIHHPKRVQFEGSTWAKINSVIFGLTRRDSENRQPTIDALLTASDVQRFLVEER